MTTQDVIKTLRSIVAGHRITVGIPILELELAADKLEELLKDYHKVNSELHELKYWRRHPTDELEKAINEAASLATSIHKTEFSDVNDWGLCDSVAGIITQIDNMYAGVRNQRNEARDEVDRLNEWLKEASMVGEQMRHERDEARAEVERLKQKLHEARIENSGQAAQLERTRPEPSRLEIAARLMAANLSRETQEWETVEEAVWAVEQADALIAAAREAK
jgi:DNA repair exonuclease SbcCD ATPase subunit